ncbi:MAG: DNA translocase FtsK [Anaerolineales bacterium]
MTERAPRGRRSHRGDRRSSLSLALPPSLGRDLVAILLAATSAITLLGLAGWTGGRWVETWVQFLRSWLGLAAWLAPLLLLAGALAVPLQSRRWIPALGWGRVLAIEIAFLSLLPVLSVVDGMSLARAEAGSGGGLIGWGFGTLLGDVLGTWGTVLVLVPVMLATGWWGFRGLRVRRIAMPAQETSTILSQGEPRSAPLSRAGAKSEPVKAGVRSVPAEFRKDFRVPDADEPKTARKREKREGLPPVSFLELGEAQRVTSKDVNLTAGLIEKTLADFGLPAKVVDFRVGPAVTQFAVEPGFQETTGPDGTARRQKVRVSQISALASDLALSLSAPSLRIEAPVPGQAYVGIEVPNRSAARVRLRPILESEEFQEVDSPLAIALGRDVSGRPVAADLASMPHLLIAGTTGSGKSVCMASIATCLALNNRPEDLRLVMIDPKMVELVRFNGLPHLYARVETDLQRIVAVLRWCTMEMDRRYRLLEQAAARDLDSYNARLGNRRSGPRLPRVVVLIDELADLMMMAPDQTERTLVRLAQMARAVGLHLVVATQRPSTDILTGLIKANFPARISFAVASSVDSRVILDGQGAETLLGKGDMLFLSPEAGAPVRLQGVYVSDEEIGGTVQFWKRKAPPEPPAGAPAAPWEDVLSRAAEMEEKDDILERAIEIVKATGQASASMLQRRLRIGYPRAARLMDELEQLGLVGRVQAGGKTREILRDAPDRVREEGEDAEEEGE